MIGQASERRGLTALVTGANSGIGFAAALELASAGYKTILVACRSMEKAKRAAEALKAESGRDTFVPLEMDVARLASVRSAAETLRERGERINALILNAGVLPGRGLIKTADGIEECTAASLTGHHALTLRLLRDGLLAENARIVIAGSEGARGDAPGMKPIDLPAFAAQYCGGNLDSAVLALMKMEPPARHHWSTTYCTTKLFVALWAQALAPRLRPDLSVLAVSPGNVPTTNAGRRQPWAFRAMLAMVGAIGPSLGMTTPASVGAKRYLDAMRLDRAQTGSFLASPKGKLVGPLTRQNAPHLTDPASAAACWRAVQSLTGEPELSV
jgi:NAD(P)-dependent dehydrogenase (short-subunit alcohol dehydrogenase family)